MITIRQLATNGPTALLLLRSSVTSPIINPTSRSMAWVSNKRITRVPSDLRVDKSELDTTGNERYLNVKTVNRNPRNLEQMLLQPKPLGWEMDAPTHHYWHKLIFEKKSKYLVGKIVHNSGRTVVSVASNEPIIATKVSNGLGTDAAQLLGQILALRSLEVGIHSVHCDHKFDPKEKSKTTAFIDAFKANAMTLSEQQFIFAREGWDL